MKIDKVLTINPEGVGNFQGVFPAENGGWYVTRDDDGDMVIDRHDAAGKYKDTCTLLGAGHVTAGNEYKGRLVTTCAGKVVSFRYSAGKKLTLQNCAIHLEGAEVDSQISLSPTLGYAVVRSRSNAYSFFAKYATDTFLAGGPPLSETVVLPRDITARVEQSFGLSRDSLFLTYGAQNERNWIEHWSLATGEKIGNDEDVTSWALVPGKKHEPEFAPNRLICMKVNSGDDRRLVVGKHDLGL